MKPLKLLEISALVFGGVAIDRLWLAHGAGPVEQKRIVDHVRSVAALPVHPTQVATKLPSSSAGDRESAARLASQSVELRVERPKNGKRVLSDEEEARLDELLQLPFPRALMPGQKGNADGSIDVYGKTEDGKDLYRHFDPQGELTKEGWTDPEGENVHRTYYDSGQLKTVNWRRSDQSQTSIGFTQSGLYEYRWDKLSNGTEISTNYDDAGQVKEIWERGKDGKSVRVD